jgi:hypothetical protein
MGLVNGRDSADRAGDSSSGIHTLALATRLGAVRCCTEDATSATITRDTAGTLAGLVLHNTGEDRTGKRVM